MKLRWQIIGLAAALNRSALAVHINNAVFNLGASVSKK